MNGDLIVRACVEFLDALLPPDEIVWTQQRKG